MKSRATHSFVSISAIVLFLSFIPPAYGDVRTLVCTHYQSGNHLFEIDFNRQTTCMQTLSSPHCTGTFRAKVSGRYIIIQLAAPVSVDRKAGSSYGWMDLRAFATVMP